MTNVDLSKFEHLKNKFVFIQNNVYGDKIDLSNMKEYSPNLEPNLVRYFFKSILKFQIEIAPIEKVYFSFTFTYQQHICYITAAKFGYRLYCEEEIKEDLFSAFIEINYLIEDAFIKYSIVQIENNEYILPNDMWIFNKNISFIESKITSYNDKLIKLANQRYEEKIEKSNGGTSYSWIDKLGFESDDLSLSVINYLDFQFSKIEHLFALLYPLIYDVKNDSEPYSKYLRLNYRSKIEKCCPNINESILNDLSLIKEIHRNRFAHGFFSMEKELEIKIPNFGNYYMSVGNKIKGFKRYKDFYEYSDYLNFKTIFHNLFDYLEQNFPLQLKLINNGLPIQLDYDIYRDVFISEKNTLDYIERYFYHEDMIANMDW